MKKKSVIWGSVGIISIITILIIVIPFKKDIWDINAENLKYSFRPISGNAVIDDLSKWTPFVFCQVEMSQSVIKKCSTL